MKCESDRVSISERGGSSKREVRNRDQKVFVGLEEAGLSRLQDIGSDTWRDALCGSPRGSAREMCIPSRRIHPAVTEQPTDDYQILAECEHRAGEAVPKVVKSCCAGQAYLGSRNPIAGESDHSRRRTGSRRSAPDGRAYRYARTRPPTGSLRPGNAHCRRSPGVRNRRATRDPAVRVDPAARA